MTKIQRLCSSCRFCVAEDSGHSNYTPMDTGLACLKGLNDALDTGTDAPMPTLKFAETCGEYVVGEGPSRDVDCEVTANDFADQPDVYGLLVKRWGYNAK